MKYKFPTVNKICKTVNKKKGFGNKECKMQMYEYTVDVLYSKRHLNIESYMKL